MACDQPTAAEQKTTTTTKEVRTMEENVQTQAGVLVLKNMPEFKAEAYNAETGHYTEVSSEDYKGKWTVVCFYPADFTFVCPTEIAAMNAHLDTIKGELGCEVLAVSTDTKFSHKRFAETEPLLEGLKLTIAADPTHEMSRKFGVLIEDAGIALRGRFLINPDGVIVAQEVQAPPVGRNVKEFIRQIEAHQHAYKTGEVCPAGWKPGKKTLPVNTDVEPMTGRVGDYITLDEILAD
ncbi:peroxiredoxin [Nitratifractor sp.]|uniref:peroxiredoxin n=1 Tax=Nitratifractor sp. TaxID=2268144 RepID=UPI0025E6ECA7|nr:peroxiredoxin [Nitratifractor sp.]